MIIVRLKGGLGNQMFQYAAGKNLSEKHGVPLRFDLSFLEAEPDNYTKRYLELDKFNIIVETASAKEIKSLKKRWKNFFVPTWLKEKEKDCYDSYHRIGKRCYLDGYFQSEKFFIGISEQIHCELTFKCTLNDSEWGEIREQIKGSNSVSLHFRRGDYITNQSAHQFHGVCSLNYYQKAVEEIVKKVDNPHFFIFSDDIQWVTENFEMDYPTVFIEKKDESLHSDFQLMSLCKHNIIANSTYSWWAAWLNKNKDKIVIAPERWYANEDKQQMLNDLIPSKWITM